MGIGEWLWRRGGGRGCGSVRTETAWRVRRVMTGCQFGQDEFLDRVVYRGLRAGYFVDVGAHDGEEYSGDAFFFERERGWQGLCIEANPAVFAQLATRDAPIASSAASPRGPTA